MIEIIRIEVKEVPFICNRFGETMSVDVVYVNGTPLNSLASGRHDAYLLARELELAINKYEDCNGVL